MCEQTRVLPEFVGSQASGRHIDPLDKSSSLWWRLTGPSRHAATRQASTAEGVYASIKPLAKSLPHVDKPAPEEGSGEPPGIQSNVRQRQRSLNASLNHANDQWQSRSLNASPSDTLDSPADATSPISRSCESLDEPEIDYSDNEEASSTDAAKETAEPSSHHFRRERDTPIYANFPPLPCPPSPPHPSPDEQPLRFLSDHWAEFDARGVGRKFYYNFHTGQRSWKPPRRRGELPATHEREHANLAPQSVSPRISQRKGPPPLPPAKKKPPIQSNALSSSQDSLLSSSRDSLLSSSREDLLSSSRDSLSQSSSTGRSRPPVNHPGSSSLPRESTSEESVQQNGNSKFYFARGSRLAMAYQSAADRWYSSAEDPSQVTSDRPRLLPSSSIEEETDSLSESPSPWERRAPVAENSSGARGGHYPGVPPTLTPKLNRLKPTPPPVLPLSSSLSEAKHARAMRTRSMILPEDYPLHGPSVAEAIETFDSLELVTRQGTLNKTELVRAGKKQKKSWSPAYVVLTNRNLFLYKDINTAQEKPAGKSSELQINLAGAVIDWCPDKSKRRNVFQLSTTAGQKVLLQDDNVQTSKEWFDTISAAIKRLPNGLGLVMGWQPEQPPAPPPPPEETAPPPSSSFASRRSKKAGRTKSIRQPASPPAPTSDAMQMHQQQHQQQQSQASGVVDSCGSQSPQERKNRIRNKLRQFFVRRPTLESLQEKGIFKDEPVFGCTLAHLCEKDRSSVPRFVQECILEIERRDMTADGLYRASGNLSQVQKVRCHVNQDDYSVLAQEEDIHVLTGALKMFFRHMKEPLFPYNLFTKFLKAIGQPTRTTKLAMFRDLLSELPRPNYDTLKYLLRHLLRVTEHSDKNRMHIQNLAIVFGPTLLSSGEEPRNLALDMMQQNQVIEFLLLEFNFLFP
uniref:Signal transduction n=1 Tax=Rhipicephalus zambeziensis TaxID=60191 RepID=A0A224Z8T1_9ACAR